MPSPGDLDFQGQTKQQGKCNVPLLITLFLQQYYITLLIIIAHFSHYIAARQIIFKYLRYANIFMPSLNHEVINISHTSKYFSLW
jgi:hypothetical protein